MIPITADSTIFTLFSGFFHPLHPPQNSLFLARKTIFIVSYQYIHMLFDPLPSNHSEHHVILPSCCHTGKAPASTAMYRTFLLRFVCDLSPPMRVSTGEYYPELLVSKLVSSYFYTKQVLFYLECLDVPGHWELVSMLKSALVSVDCTKFILSA